MDEQAHAIGIFGGTFNPVHHGHLIAARDAGEQLGLTRVLLMPNRRSPLRRTEPLLPAEQRLELIRRAVQDEPLLSACDVEVRREGLSYLVDSLRELREAHPGVRLCFLMGEDSLATFDQWVRVEEIVELAEVWVMPRPGGASESSLAALEERMPALKGKVRLLKSGPRIEISSSGIRERLRRGASVRFLVPGAVLRGLEESGGVRFYQEG